MGKKRIGAVALLMILIVAVSVVITLFTGTVRPEKTGETRIMASFYPVYVAAMNLTREVEGVQLESLVGPRTGCLHDYQMAPDDMAALEGADILLLAGAGAESFLQSALEQFPSLVTVDASQGIDLLDGHHHHEGEDPHEHEEAAVNEHYWVSPSRYATMVENLRDGLCSADPDHAAAYEANAEAYLDSIRKVEAELEETAASLNFRDCITFHDSVAYLADDLGLNTEAALSIGEDSGIAASDAAAAQQAAAQAVRVLLLYDSQYPQEYAYVGDRAEESRAVVLQTGVTGPETADAWLEAMEENLSQLRAL